MRQARPSDDQFDRLFEFMQLVESLVEYERLPDTDELPGRCIEHPAERLEIIEAGYRKVASCWQRVLFGGQCAIQNACDPNLGHLEFKPEILRGMALVANAEETSQS